MENTIAAFELALASSCDGIEADVRLTSDGVAVIIHDRVVGNSRLAVSGLTHHELESTILHPVPLLDDLITSVAPTFWNLEIKSRDAVDACCQFLQKNEQCEWLVTSFDYRIVRDVARRTSARCGVLTGHWVDDAATFLGAFSQSPNIDTVVWSFDFLDAGHISIAKELGFQNYVWNALTDADMKRCIELDVDAIIMDDVASAIRIVRG